jgi:hypothetical protein
MAIVIACIAWPIVLSVMLLNVAIGPLLKSPRSPCLLSVGAVVGLSLCVWWFA